LSLWSLHVVKEILYFENPIKEVLYVEMTIKVRKVNFNPEIVGILRSSSIAFSFLEVVFLLTR